MARHYCERVAGDTKEKSQNFGLLLLLPYTIICAIDGIKLFLAKKKDQTGLPMLLPIYSQKVMKLEIQKLSSYNMSFNHLYDFNFNSYRANHFMHMGSNNLLPIEPKGFVRL